MSTETRFFDISALAATLPQTAETMLTDLRLTDERDASCRIFRVYRAVPSHFHTSSDEYLFVLTGRAEIQIQGSDPRVVGPGEPIFFKKNTVHAMPRILDEPYTVLAIDTPRRPPDDIPLHQPRRRHTRDFQQDLLAEQHPASNRSPPRFFPLAVNTEVGSLACRRSTLLFDKSRLPATSRTLCSAEPRRTKLTILRQLTCPLPAFRIANIACKLLQASCL